MTNDNDIAASRAGIYGADLAGFFDLSDGAIQFSPLIPGSSELENLDENALASMTMRAPPGTLERRYAMALALRAVAPGGEFNVLARNDRGGTRLRKEIQNFGCDVVETSRRHHRIAVCKRPKNPIGIDAAIAAGGLQMVDDMNLWSQPGIFSWDRIDSGTSLLIAHLPPLTGRGADFGCGIGVLARAVLTSENVHEMTLIDIDRRAIQAAKRNISDPRARFHWGDLRDVSAASATLDFVVMNAPFHDSGREDKALAQSFVTRAAAMLRGGGVCWLIANRHLPYEGVVAPLFSRVVLRTQTDGYKIYEAQK